MIKCTLPVTGRHGGKKWGRRAPSPLAWLDWPHLTGEREHIKEKGNYSKRATYHLREEKDQRTVSVGYYKPVRKLSRKEDPSSVSESDRWKQLSSPLFTKHKIRERLATGHLNFSPSQLQLFSHHVDISVDFVKEDTTYSSNN